MKILMISSGFPPKVNTGAEKFCYELSKKLILEGINVEVATDTDLDEYEGIKLHHLKKVENKYLRKFLFDYYNPLNVSIIKKILLEVRPDIVHFHNIYGISTQLISYVSKKYPAVVTVHDYWPFCFNSTLLHNGNVCNMNCFACRFPLGIVSKNIKSRHLKNAFFVAPSDFMRKKLTENGINNVCTIHNAVDLPPEVETDSKRLFYIGRLSREKGVLFLIDAVVESGLSIDIIGVGPLFSNLKEKLNYLNQSKVNLKGFVEDISDEYKNGGILIVPSIWPENLPYVVLEGMSYGLPVMASKVGGIPEMIEHNNTGLLFEPGNKDDLKKQLVYLSRNPEMIQEFRKNARKMVEVNFCWECTIRSYLDLYKRLTKA